MTAYRCDEKKNNCVTGDGDGRLTPTTEKTLIAHNNTLQTNLVLERDHFVLLEFRREA